MLEILFPEFANLYGEIGDIKLLRQIFQDQYINTSFSQEPYFAQKRPQMIFMGPMSEFNQKKVIEKLMPYRQRLIELIEDGVFFLFIGNAWELMIDSIDYGSEKLAALGLFPLEAKVDTENRLSGPFLGLYEDLEIVGFRSQFSHIISRENDHPLFQTRIGTGSHPEESWEGIHYQNFFGTYIVGPFLICNPLFLQGIINQAHPQARIPAYSLMNSAYQARLQDFYDHCTQK